MDLANKLSKISINGSPWTTERMDYSKNELIIIVSTIFLTSFDLEDILLSLHFKQMLLLNSIFIYHP